MAIDDASILECGEEQTTTTTTATNADSVQLWDSRDPRVSKNKPQVHKNGQVKDSFPSSERDQEMAIGSKKDGRRPQTSVVAQSHDGALFSVATPWLVGSIDGGLVVSEPRRLRDYGGDQVGVWQWNIFLSVGAHNMERQRSHPAKGTSDTHLAFLHDTGVNSFLHTIVLTKLF